MLWCYSRIAVWLCYSRTEALKRYQRTETLEYYSGIPALSHYSHTASCHCRTVPGMGTPMHQPSHQQQQYSHSHTLHMHRTHSASAVHTHSASAVHNHIHSCLEYVRHTHHTHPATAHCTHRTRHSRHMHRNHHSHSSVDYSDKYRNWMIAPFQDSCARTCSASQNDTLHVTIARTLHDSRKKTANSLIMTCNHQPHENTPDASFAPTYNQTT